VPRELAEHALHVRPDAKPVKQPLRQFADDRRKAIWEEVARLLAADFIMGLLHLDGYLIQSWWRRKRMSPP
jgi:hypothetical protein